MAEEKKYTESEYRKRVLEVIDVYCQVKNKYDQGNLTIYKSHELRTFIANAKQMVPVELRNPDFQRCLKGLEEKLSRLNHS